MIWIAALYFSASPKAGSSTPIGLFIVLQAHSAVAAAAISKNLEDMSIILLEAARLLGLRHSAGRRKHGRRRRLDEWRGPGRNAGIGAPVQEQVGLVRRPDMIRRRLQRPA